jgi:hypothetical protein
MMLTSYMRLVEGHGRPLTAGIKLPDCLSKCNIGPIKPVQLGVPILLSRPSQSLATEPIGHRTEIYTAAVFRLYIVICLLLIASS